MNNTPNYGYNLPEYLEDADVVILNQNFTAIDKDILDVRQIAVLMYDSDEHYDTDDLVGYENPTDHHIRMFRCLEDNVTGVWDSTKWTNTNVAAELLRRSGGGTEVEANPSGSATDYLTKVKIGNTIYAVTPADMTGATSQAAGAHGLVPAPSAGDDGKVLYGDGTWKTPQSAPSNLGDLGDVTLTTPTEGQILAYDGDEWVNTDAPDVDVTKTATGNPVEISDSANAPLVKCVTQITGSQDLHGYDKPWVGGAGKNKLKYPYKNTSGTINGIVFTDNGDGTLTANGTSTARTIFYTHTANENFAPPTGQYIFTKGFAYSDDTNVGIIIEAYNGSTYVKKLARSYGLDAVNCNIDYDGFDSTEIYLEIKEGITVSNLLFKPMLRLATVTDSTFAPYSNICPITAYTEGEIEVSDGDGNTTTHTTTYPSAIYRGSEDVVNGEVTSSMPVIDLGDLTWSKISANNIFYTESLVNTIKKPAQSTDIANIVCECFETRSANFVQGANDGISVGPSGTIIVYDSTKTSMSSSDFATAVTGVKLAYELATPTTSSVTPTNLPIKSLNGYSHIESSTGDMEIEYITGKYQPIVDLISESSEKAMHHYSTDEQVVGTWIDGSPVYEKVYEFPSTFTMANGNQWYNTSFSRGDINLLIDIVGIQSGGATYSGLIAGFDSGYISLLTYRYTDLDVFILRYTKTSTRSLSKGATETEKTSLEPISEPLETKTDNLSKDDEKAEIENESKEIEEVTEEPTEVTEEEPVDPEPSKEETDER